MSTCHGASRAIVPLVLLVAALSTTPSPAAAQEVLRERKLSALPRNSGATVSPSDRAGSPAGLAPHLGGILHPLDRFGSSVVCVGDLDRDGVDDLAVGAPGDDHAATDQGAVWILFLRADGRIRSCSKLHEPGPPPDQLEPGGEFGVALANLGDLDGDGYPELAVGAPNDNGGASDTGAVWILFLTPNATVRELRKIGPGAGGFGGVLEAFDHFGSSLAALDDMDGNGVPELAVGVPGEDVGNRGGLWILFLESDGSVASEQHVRSNTGGFGALESGDAFGTGLAGIEDLDGDGVTELAVGAPGAGMAGALWILFLESDGTVRSALRHEIERCDEADQLGASLASLGDLDGDGNTDVAAGAPRDDEMGSPMGAVWILLLESDGSVKAEFKIGATAGEFGGVLHESDDFGACIAALPDRDGNGMVELAVGAPRDDGGGLGQGAVWLLFLESEELIHPGTVHAETRISPTAFAGFEPSSFGCSAVSLGDLDGDGIADLAVGARGTGTASSLQEGAVWIVFLNADGSVKAQQEIGDGTGGFAAPLTEFERFGTSLAALGDMDGDQVCDLAVGTEQRDANFDIVGSVWILFLNSDGTVKAQRKIGEGSGGFGGAVLQDLFGCAVACIGDLDHDGTSDLAVGALGDYEGGAATGSVWILFLDPDGTVHSEQKINALQGGFGGTLEPGALFGTSVAALGDLDGDGNPDLAVGASGEGGGSSAGQGAVWILFLAPDGTVLHEQEIHESTGGFSGVLWGHDRFGRSLACPGDLDGDGTADLAVGAFDYVYQERGAIWILFLEPDGTVKTHRKISSLQGGFDAFLAPDDEFGTALGALGDFDGDGSLDLLTASPRFYEGSVMSGAAWILSLDGRLRLDFERQDDRSTVLPNGRTFAAQPFPHFVTVTASGSNAGAALFDTAPGGPNAAGPDPDLLIGSGNVLVLQADEDSDQSVPGIFDRPNDDDGGGVLRFEFPAEVSAESVDLVGVAPGGGSARVTLFDAVGRTRAYDVPPGWTEDLVLHGPPAVRTLDLTTLVPQPGFLATATAAESPGFDRHRVTAIEIALDSSGAIDDLTWNVNVAGAQPRLHGLR